MKESMHRMAMLAPSPARICLAVWLSAMALAIGAQQVSAASVTYIVGTCVSGTQFSTIQKALDATPAPDTVKVCPGQYAEQITISHPVTLEGIAEGNGAQARIVAAGGMTINTTLSGGFPAVAQIYVNNVSGGDVNLTNLEVNGSGNGEGGTGNYFIGVLYQGSSGKMNQVITSNQDGTDVTGLGMWIEGGSSSSSVTVENCSVHDFTYGGIHAAGVTTPPNLTVTMKNNVVSALSEGTVGIFLDEGTDPTVSGNITSGGIYGISTDASEGSITGNTIVGSQIGIAIGTDGPMVTSNNIYDTIQYGIQLNIGPLKVARIEHNVIKSVRNPGTGGGTGIEINCLDTTSTVANSNTLMDMNYGYGDAPAGFAATGTYLGVLFKVGTCTGASVPSKAGAAARPKLLGRSPEQ